MSGPTTIPAGTNRADVVDVDGDGLEDVLWIGDFQPDTGAVRVGVVTAAGGGIVRDFVSASPVQRSALVVDVDEMGPVEILAYDGRTVLLWAIVGCEIVDVRDEAGDAIRFDTAFGDDGLGCVVTADGRRLARYHLIDPALDWADAPNWTMRILELDGATAIESDMEPATVAPDPAIVCGDVSVWQDALVAPLA